MDITAKSLSHGTGGSYTEWQREPPNHKVYEVEVPEYTLTITVFAENRAKDPENHPTITKIRDASDFASDISWDELDTNTKNAVREHINDLVKDAELFKD